MDQGYDPLKDMIDALPAKTGRGFEAWQAILRDKGIGSHREIVAFLKQEHGLTHGYANAIALKSLRSDAGSADPASLVAAMFGGGKKALRPVFDRIMAIVDSLGSDVVQAPKKGYLSLRRSKQFALVQPSTKTRLDLGLVLRGRAPAGRLEASGSWNGMVTHRMRIERLEEVDAEVEDWLRQAYTEA